MPSDRLSILSLTKLHFVDSLRCYGHRVLTVGFNKANFELYKEDLESYPAAGNGSVLRNGFDYFYENGAHIRDILGALPPDFTPDVIVYHDDSNPVLYVSGLEDSPVPLLFYSVDCHIHRERHKIYSGLFDRVLVAQKDFVEPFKEACPNTQWFPLWSRVHPDPSTLRDIPVAFRGCLNAKINKKRVDFFRELGTLVPLDSGTGPFCDTFRRAKIVINQAIGRDINFRVFEAMACGAMLVTPEIPNGQQDLFQPGVHLIEYADGDVNDAAAKIMHYLQHDAERETIAAAGRELVLSRHVEEARARQFESHLLDLKVTNRSKKYFAAMYHYLLDAKVESMIFKRPHKARESLLAAKRAAQAAALRREDFKDLFFANLIGIKCLMTAEGMHAEALDLIRAVRQETTEMPMYGILYVGTLLQSGFRKEADSAARALKNFGLSSADDALQMLREVEKPTLKQIEDDRQRLSTVDPKRLRS